MALSLRQQKAFTDVGDLYAPNARTTTAKGMYKGATYGPDPTYSNVRFHIQPASEASVAMEMGRSNRDIIDTTDRIRVHADQDIGDQWYVLLKTEGHPETGTWFVVVGGRRTQFWRAKESILYIKRTTTPPMVLPPPDPDP